MGGAQKHGAAGTLVILAALLLLAGCTGGAAVTEPMAQLAAPATLPGPVAAMPPSASVPDDQRVRCEDTIVTGSRVPQRICRTELQWKLLEEQSKERGRELQGPMYGSGDVAGAGTPPL